MSNIQIKFNLLESEKEISLNILNALLPRVDRYFKAASKKIRPKLVNIVIEAIKSSPEYQSLVSGDLKAQFGLPDADSRLSSIVSLWKKIDFIYNPVVVRNNYLSGSFSLNMIRSDFLDVINTEAAVFVTPKGSQLNWLEWLCLEGNKTIIKDYVIELGPNPRSRTNMAIMRGEVSGKWSVPSEFSGTIENNWITRAIDSVTPNIQQAIKEGMGF